MFNLFVATLYFQIKLKDSLRDIITGLGTQYPKLYHSGVTRIHHSTLSDANNKRDFRIYERLFYQLSIRCKEITHNNKILFHINALKHLL